MVIKYHSFTSITSIIDNRLIHNVKSIINTSTQFACPRGKGNKGNKAKGVGERSLSSLWCPKRRYAPPGKSKDAVGTGFRMDIIRLPRLASKCGRKELYLPPPPLLLALSGILYTL